MGGEEKEGQEGSCRELVKPGEECFQEGVGPVLDSAEVIIGFSEERSGDQNDWR